MNRLLTLLLAALCWSSVSAFCPVARPTTTTALHVFGNKKAAAAKAEEEAKYWQGEWVCKDCGYIYNRVRQIEIVDASRVVLTRIVDCRRTG